MNAIVKRINNNFAYKKMIDFRSFSKLKVAIDCLQRKHCHHIGTLNSVEKELKWNCIRFRVELCYVIQST